MRATDQNSQRTRESSGRKKEETFFFFKKKLILSWFTNARDKFSILESFSLNALGFLWAVFKIKREKNRRQKSIEGYDKPQRTWMYLCLMTAIVANKCICPSLFMVGEICLTWKVWNQRAYCDHGYSISCSDTTISETTINHHVNIPPCSVPPLDSKRAWRVKFPFPLLWLVFFVKAFYIWSIFPSIALVRVIRPTKRLLDVLVVLITQEDT